MDLTNYFTIVKNEQSAYKYLSKKCLKNGHRFCPRCKQRKLYKLADKRRRCSRCKYTFHDFSGRWINHGRFSCVQWLHLIKLFELELSVRKMAEQMNMAYNTVYNAIQTIRYAILAHAEDAADLLKGEIEIDKATLVADVKATEAVVLPEKCLYSAFLSEMAKFVLQLCQMSQPEH